MDLGINKYSIGEQLNGFEDQQLRFNHQQLKNTVFASEKCTCGGFHQWGIPKIDQNGWFIMENPSHIGVI